MTVRQRLGAAGHEAVPAAFTLPAAGGLLLLVGAVAAVIHPPVAVVVTSCAVVCGAVCLVTPPAGCAAIAVLGWWTATAFSAAPYGELRLGGTASVRGLVSCVGAAVAATGIGILVRRRNAATRRTLDDVDDRRRSGFGGAVPPARVALAIGVAAIALPGLTAALAADRQHLSLTDDLLFFLSLVVAIAVIGGFWPAVVAAVASSLLVNWYFTPPLHTFTIGEPDNLIALLLFVVVAISVSSVVHLAARRAELAALNNREAGALLQLARTALAAEDTSAAILGHLHEMFGVAVDLVERAGATWVVVASSAAPSARSRTDDVVQRLDLRPGLQLVVRGPTPLVSHRLLEAAGAQLAVALDRDRLRTQAAQAEALAASNRMRTALLAAVSHDLRTPLASIKASISSLRQTEVTWSPEDEAELLETIEESTDRLSALIANLLDMSRVQTGALQPYLRPASVEEIVPVALRGLPGGAHVDIGVPEDLPLVLTDAGLLERVLANLLENALRWSPADHPPAVVARHANNRVEVCVIDHGPGVAEPDRDRMFEPFQRLGDQDARTGVGLGLAVARGLAEAVGGALTAAETPGGGLTMIVSVPAAHADRAIEALPS